MKPQTNVSLKEYSTIRTGGPAEYFIEVKTKKEFIGAVKWARARTLKLTVLGNGSNILIPDAGVKGLVIKNSTGRIELGPARPFRRRRLEPRFKLLEPDPEINQLAYDESQYPAVEVKLDSGVFLPRAIFTLINQGITGLEWFAGIPATAGGATYINLHGADRYWSDYLTEAEILNHDNRVKTVSSAYFHYDYDQSSLKQSADLVLSVSLNLRRGPKEKALAIAKYWQVKKAHQPQRSLGCIFQNLSAEEQKRLGLPTPSIGYLVDKKLGLKGRQAGQARIALKHAGFVENLGKASSADVLILIDLIQKTARKKLGLELKPEIVIL